MTEFAWLIERPGPVYWSGHTLTGFTRHADNAVRFVRRQDAVRVIESLLKDSASADLADCVAVEHGWG